MSYLSDYELLNKDIDPRIYFLDKVAPRIQVNYESRCVGREWWRWWWLGCRPFGEVDLIQTGSRFDYLQLWSSRSIAVGPYFMVSLHAV